MQTENEFATEVAENGFALVRNAVKDSEISKLISVIEALRQRDKDPSSAGVRHLLRRSAVVRKFAKSAAMINLAAKVIGNNAKPVKAILFDKTPASNWYVTWHQDLTIAVKEKIEFEGFGPWSVKDDVPHVQPPRKVLQNIVSLRVHLDACPSDNGAIKFIARSHNVGIMDTAEIAKWRDTEPHICCSADRGDVIVMRPLVLHSSSQSTKVDHRRVLHIEFVGEDLPNGLRWAESSGLDSVELVMAIEEEFGLEIPNEDAEKITTVGETYEYLRSKLNTTDSGECISQKIFYKLRRALIENFQVRRQSITPDTKMSDLITMRELEEGWPYLQMFIEMQTPDFKTANHIFFFKQKERSLTMRELVFALINLNQDKIDFSKSMDAEVWNRLVDVVVRQVNASRQEVVYGASFAKDLGVC